jgi:hypothetical protein
MINFFHLWTPENQQIILTCEGDFKMAMNIFALCAAMSSGVAILTFELMDNHIHVTLYGSEEDIRSFFTLFKRHLAKWHKCIGRAVDLSGFNCNLRALNSALDIKNVLSYNNRNGFLVNPNETPFSYKWGAGCYFFNPDAKQRYQEKATRMTLAQRREILHSHAADKIEHLKMLDGYVCPLSFCDIDGAEKYYRNASNYFYEISRNIESQRLIAQEIGESICYSDDELFRIAVSLSKQGYNQSSPSLLPQTAKTELACRLHYDWGATKKQLCRIIKLPIGLLDALFASPQR